MNLGREGRVALVKVLGYVRMAQAVWPAMRARRWGRIVNVIGSAARNPSTTYMAGGIANAGLINFTRALADLGRRTTCWSLR